MLVSGSTAHATDAAEQYAARNLRLRDYIANSTGIRSAARAIIAVLLAFLVTAGPILLSGNSPRRAYASLISGAFGSFDRIAFALNKSTPYILIAVGIALCFRAGIINIG